MTAHPEKKPWWIVFTMSDSKPNLEDLLQGQAFQSLQFFRFETIKAKLHWLLKPFKKKTTLIRITGFTEASIIFPRASSGLDLPDWNEDLFALLIQQHQSHYRSSVAVWELIKHECVRSSQKNVVISNIFEKTFPFSRWLILAARKHLRCPCDSDNVPRLLKH